MGTFFATNHALTHNLSVPAVVCCRLIVFPLSIVLRVLLSYLLHASDLYSSISTRGELTNALVSFTNVQESVSNVRVANVSPYAGLSSSHAPPLLLALFTELLHVPSNAATSLHGSTLFFTYQHLALLSVWCVLDCLISWMLFSLVRVYYARYPSPTIALPYAHALTRANRWVEHSALLLAATYVLNPITLTSSVLFNLSHVSHLVVVAVLLSASHGKPVACGSLLGLALYLDLYPVLLVIPVLLLLHRSRCTSHPEAFPQYQISKHIRHDLCSFVDGTDGITAADGDALSDVARARTLHDASFTLQRVLKIAFQPVALPEGVELELPLEGESESPEGVETKRAECAFQPIPSDAALGVLEHPWKWNLPLVLLYLLSLVLSLSLLLYASFLLSGSSWSFLRSSYGYSLALDSLSPTYSLFWYFFTSIFDRFHTFFLVCFHVHTLVYVLPLSMRLAEEPLFLCSIFLLLSEFFRAYSTLPGILFGVLCFVLPHLCQILLHLRRVRLLSFLCCLSLLTQLLMRFLWLSTGGGNGNFLFFQHTLFCFTLLLLVMEVVGSVRRRQASVLEGRVQETLTRRRESRRVAQLAQRITPMQHDIDELQEESKKHV
jgi:hypothetical protein